MSSSLRKALSIVVPTCFAVGFCVEVFMIKVPIGGRNFYDVAIQKEAERRLAHQEAAEAETPL